MILRSALTALIFVGALIRLHHLGEDSFDDQEILRINSAVPAYLEAHGRGEPRRETSSPVPLAATQLGLRWGFGEATLRLPSAIAGTGAICAVWLLGKVALGSEVGLYAAALLSASAPHVALSRQVGSEAWLVVFSSLAVAAFLWCLRRVGAGQGLSGRSWVAFVAASSLAVLSGYAALFVIAALLVALAGHVIGRRLSRSTAVLIGFGLVVSAGIGAAWFLYAPPNFMPSIFPLSFRFMVQQELSNALSGGRYGMYAALALGICGCTGGVWIVTRRRVAAVIPLWLIIGAAGVVVSDWSYQLLFRPEQMGVLLPPLFVLAGAGLCLLRRTLVRGAPLWIVRSTPAVVVTLVVVMSMPALAAYFQVARPPWRDAAAIVRANARAGDVIVTLLNRDSFIFYAPDLERQTVPNAHTSLVPAYFVHPEHGWLVVPKVVKLFPDWAALQGWLRIVPPVNLSPSPDIDVFYIGKRSHDELLMEAAFSELPVGSLVQGSLMLDFLLRVGSYEPVLWKVDQIALSRQPLPLHNPELLKVVYFLAAHGQGGRAASLAYRLATAEPTWPEAQQALAAFELPR